MTLLRFYLRLWTKPDLRGVDAYDRRIILFFSALARDAELSSAAVALPDANDRVPQMLSAAAARHCRQVIMIELRMFKPLLLFSFLIVCFSRLFY